MNADLALRLGISAWLAAAAVWDLRTARIPNWLTLPVAAAAGAWRLYNGDWLILPVWVLLYGVWLGNVVGGGDAKLLMGIFAMFPTQLFVVTFAALVLAVSVPLLVVKYWGSRPHELLAQVADRVSSQNVLPSQEELQQEGRQYAWTFCLPGLVYLWWLW